MAISNEVVTTTTREGRFNKNAARRVRHAGRIPAVVYGAGQESIALEVDPRQIIKILHSESGHNSIFDLEVAGARTKAMIVDWQYEPVKSHLLHIDFKRIAMDKMLRVQVPIQLVGVPLGVRTQGGILDQVQREVEIECLPADIPKSIDLDVTELSFGQVLRVSDLDHGGKMKFLTPEDNVVAHIVAIKEEVVETPDATAAAAIEGAPAEPEVLKKGKQDADAAAPAADAKAKK
jgi:large subunit ribosomal protein L25